MATITEWTDEQKAEWETWVSSRPPVIQDLCRRFPPTQLYHLKTAGQRVTIYSYAEDGTLTVIASGDYNYIDFARKVFGIKPEDLEECDLPGDDEIVGVEYDDPAKLDIYIAEKRKQLGFS